MNHISDSELRMNQQAAMVAASVLSEPVVYPLERAADATASLEDRTGKGKVVVKLR